MKTFYDSLRRNLDNGTYAAMCPDTSVIDNYHRRKLLTDDERDQLIARWNELNQPPVEEPEPDPSPEPEPETPAEDTPQEAADGAVAS